jgi:hypothetical protein
MQVLKISSRALSFLCLLMIGWSLPAPASDVLDLVPTREKPVDARVKALTKEQLRAIELPSDGNTVVISITKLPTSTKGSDSPTDPKPYLIVHADGKIDCQNPIPLPGIQRRQDTLSKDELTWLLHLAVNECHIVQRTSEAIDAAYQKLPRHPDLPDVSTLRFYADASSHQATLAIPENAIIVRQTCAQFKLIPFTSLLPYASFFVNRAYLAPAERQPILDLVNEKLKAEVPDVPPFTIEDIGGSWSTDKVDLSASFVREHELQPNQFKTVLAMVIRNEKGGRPICTITSHGFSKYRPSKP